MNDSPSPVRIILGGTFDPVHHGHLYIADILAQLLRPARSFLMPCHTPPHRRKLSASPAARLAMVQQAAVGTTIAVDAREIQRGGISYTSDTLQEIRAEEGAERSLCLALGMDAFAAIDTWRNWRSLFDLAHLAIFPRADIPLPKAGAAGRMLKERNCREVRDLQAHPAGRIWIAPCTPPSISATEVRGAIAAGRAPKDALPVPVWSYICRHRLYGAASDGHG